MAAKAADALGIALDLMSYKQSLPAGQKFREWIVRNVKPMDRDQMVAAIKSSDFASPHEVTSSG
jgi:cystathionine beta-lyase family protein involved in aluminum resistance